MRRLALVALVVLLAGCSFAGGSEEPTVTAAPVPTVDEGEAGENRTADGGDEQTAGTGPGPWIADGEFRSARALAGIHGEILSHNAYRVDEHYEWTSNGVEVRDIRVVQNATTWYGGSTVRHERSRYLAPLSNASAGYWRNVSAFEWDGRRSIRVHENGTTDYRAVENPGSSVGRIHPNSSRAIAQMMAVEDATAELLFWNGQGYYRIQGSDASGPGFGLAENYTVEAVVETSGLVRWMRVSYTESTMGRERSVVYEMRITLLHRGEPGPPDWADRANATEPDG